MLRLNFLFQDGMILPPDTGIPVWGSTAPEAQIEVSVAGKTAFTKADASGEFVAGLPGMSAGGHMNWWSETLPMREKLLSET